MMTEFVLEQDEWIQIAPLGDHPHEMGIQRVDAEMVAGMARRFNSFGGRLGRIFAGAPVFEGHHDTNPDRYPNGRSFAWVMELEDRGLAGLWGRLKWTPQGRDLVKSGNYKFVSPVWDAVEIGRENGRIVYRPQRLLSLALTNLPNLPLPPLANERTSMKTLVEILELKGEPSAEEICSAAETLANARGAEKDRAERLANDLILANKRAEDERAGRIKLLLENAILRGGITLAEQEHWRGELAANFEKAEKALGEAKSALNQNSQTQHLGNEKSMYETADSRRTLVNSFIMEKMSAGMAHMDAWELAKATYPEIFAKMQAGK